MATVSYSAKEIDRLYEVEDFLRNIGEQRRADDVMIGRRMLKALTAACWDYKEYYDRRYR